MTEASTACKHNAKLMTASKICFNTPLQTKTHRFVKTHRLAHTYTYNCTHTHTHTRTRTGAQGIDTMHSSPTQRGARHSLTRMSTRQTDTPTTRKHDLIPTRRHHTKNTQSMTHTSQYNQVTKKNAMP